VCDFTDLATLVWRQVQKDDDLSSGKTVAANLRVCGVWQLQVNVVFDVRVVDTDVPSYQGRTPQAVLCTAETEKRW